MLARSLGFSVVNTMVTTQRWMHHLDKILVKHIQIPSTKSTQHLIASFYIVLFLHWEYIVGLANELSIFESDKATTLKPLSCPCVPFSTSNGQ